MVNRISSRTLLRLVAVAGVLVLVTACQPLKKKPPPPPPVLTQPPPGSPVLAQELVLSGLDTPWDIAFTPDGGTLVFTEKRSGVLSRIDENGAKQVIDSIPVHALSATGSEGVEPQHAGHVEAGLLGVAVHPDFGTNHWIYLCFTTDTDVRVQRYVLDATDWVGIDATNQPAVTGIPLGEIHHGCRVRFQPGTTNLFVTTGDATIPTGPQSGASLGGKVLRVDQNLQPVPGNPGIGVPGYDGRIYTGGHRNVQGLAFAPDGAPYTTEHGPDRNDEVDRLVAGGNGGWDPNNNGTYYQFVPMTDLVKFPAAMRPMWRSGDAGTLAPSGADFLVGPQWGSWDGALAVAFLKGRQLMIMLRNPDGTVHSTWSELQIAPVQINGQTRYPRLRAATLGPDGSLYVATDAPVEALADNFPGEIWKITPTS